MQSKLLQRNAQTLVEMFYKVMCIHKSDAGFLKIVRYIAAVYACVATMILLLNMSRVILKSKTIIGRF